MPPGQYLFKLLEPDTDQNIVSIYSADGSRLEGLVVGLAAYRADDPRQWIFGHDATTLGGSSGSPIIAWKDGGGGFGIHFAGTSVDSNFAHAMAKCVDVLKRLGVKVVEP